MSDRDMVCISMSTPTTIKAFMGGTVLCSRVAAYRIADIFRAECEAQNTPYRIVWSAMRVSAAAAEVLV